MLFNSYEFIFLFLPVVFFGFFVIGRYNSRFAAVWLVVASVFFYGWWNPKFVYLLLASILFNFLAGYLIGRAKPTGKSKPIFVFSISANLLLLVFFKYTNFFIATANTLGEQWTTLNIILPLGISFFTFTQIAYLVDVYRGIAHEYNVVHYTLFVTWFPHLIAGPVLHHQQMMPQFESPLIYKPDHKSIAVGLTFFSLGLFKKVILADQFAVSANPIFNIAEQGGHPMFFQAWIGLLAYTLQLYFDFSGYSDMAIGLSRMFNVKLPLNFNSPYKASNIIDFWRRWHMSLSKFLRDYLYLPLGGNRKGPVRRHVNLLATMLLGGLWHGAGWNYVLWGGIHGVYLVLNHGWRKLTGSTGIAKNRVTQSISVFITFIVVMVAWVPFRAASMSATKNIWYGMLGMNGKSHAGLLTDLGGYTKSAYLFLGLLIVWFLPNTQEWLNKYSPAWNAVSSDSCLEWKPTRRYAILVGIMIGIALLSLNRASAFLYFQF